MLPKNFTFPDLGNGVSIPFVIGPKGTISGAVASIYPILLSLVKECKMHLYLWGWAVYGDVSHDTPADVAMFCQELTDFPGDPLNPTYPTPIVRALCSHRNCTDDDCNGEPGDPRRKR